MKRGKPLVRRTALQAKKGLQVGKTLASAGFVPRSPMRTIAHRRTREAAVEGTSRPERKRPRETGPSQKARAIVWARFAGRCAGCGTIPPPGLRSVQHIVARGVGGTNDLTNLIGLCGTATMPPEACHPRCERRNAEMHRRRLWLKSTEEKDSAHEPLELWDKTRVFLTADGGYIAEAPAGAA